MTQIIGHRGFPQKFPENTVLGISKAIQAGVDGVEIDIQLTSDGQCVLMHDTTLNRTTNAKGNIGTFTLDDLEKVSAHEPQRFGDLFKGEPIPSLDIISTLCASHQCDLYIELKLEDNTQVVREHYVDCAVLASESARRERKIISYDRKLLEICRRKYGIPVGWVLTQYDDTHRLAAIDWKPDYLICNNKKLPNNDEPLWSGGWKWFIYDVTDKGVMASLVQRGATHIETWNPTGLLVKEE